MESKSWTPEELERYLRGELPEAEAAALQAQSATDEELAQALSDYGYLLAGLDELRGQSQKTEMQAWEAELSDMDDTELIAWYLEGELAPSGEALVEQRIAADTVFAQEVDSYRPLLNGFSELRGQNLRQKMQQWEAEQQTSPATLRVASKRPGWQYAAAAAVALLIATAALMLFARSQYSGPALATQFYQAPLAEGTMGGEAVDLSILQRQFAAAHQQLQQEVYNGAFMGFDSLLRQLPTAELDEFNRTYLKEQAEWNRLLAAVAMPAPPIDVRAEARRIAQQPDHEFAQAAAELENRLSSIWYQWAN